MMNKQQLLNSIEAIRNDERNRRVFMNSNQVIEYFRSKQGSNLVLDNGCKVKLANVYQHESYKLDLIFMHDKEKLVLTIDRLFSEELILYVPNSLYPSGTLVAVTSSHQIGFVLKTSLENWIEYGKQDYGLSWEQ